MTNALLLCSLIVGEWMCLIWRERCRCYRRYNSQLRCESPRQTLTSVKETQSTPLFTLCRRCLPAWRRLPSLLCIWLQGSGSKRGSQEAGSGRPRLMKRSPLLSGVAGEVYCTLCIHTSDTRWRDVSGRRAANAGGGFAVSLKDSLTEVAGADGVTLTPADDLSAAGESLQSWDTTNHLTLKYL